MMNLKEELKHLNIKNRIMKRLKDIFFILGLLINFNCCCTKEGLIPCPKNRQFHLSISKQQFEKLTATSQKSFSISIKRNKVDYFQFLDFEKFIVDDNLYTAYIKGDFSENINVNIILQNETISLIDTILIFNFKKLEYNIEETKCFNNYITKCESLDSISYLLNNDSIYFKKVILIELP